MLVAGNFCNGDENPARHRARSLGQVVVRFKPAARAVQSGVSERKAFSMLNRLMFCLALIATIVVRAEVNVGDKPSLKVPAMDGATIDLAALKGKLVLIDFWIGRSDLNRRHEELLK